MIAGEVDKQPQIDHTKSAVKPPLLDPPDASAAATTPATTSQNCLNNLQSLDKEYNHLVATDKDIKYGLCQLEQEEATLLALEQSSTSLKEQREKEAKRKEEEAVARLENYLMMGVDHSNDNSCV